MITKWKSIILILLITAGCSQHNQRREESGSDIKEVKTHVMGPVKITDRVMKLRPWSLSHKGLAGRFRLQKYQLCLNEKSKIYIDFLNKSSETITLDLTHLNANVKLNIRDQNSKPVFFSALQFSKSKGIVVHSEIYTTEERKIKLPPDHYICCTLRNMLMGVDVDAPNNHVNYKLLSGVHTVSGVYFVNEMDIDFEELEANKSIWYGELDLPNITIEVKNVHAG